MNRSHRSAANRARNPQQKSTRRRSALGITLVVLVAIIAAWWLVTEVVTDWLWFRRLSFQQVFTTRMITAVALFLASAVLMAVVCAVTMAIAWRRRPDKPAPLESDVLDHYRQALARRTRLVIALPSIVIGVIAGAVATTHVDDVLLFINRTPFGQRDAYFNKDVSFYTFTLPFLQFVLGMVLATLIVGTIVAVIVHLITGSLHASPVRFRGPLPGTPGGEPPRVEVHNPFGMAAQVHLSIMFGLILVVYGVQQLFARYEFAISDNDTLFTGIGYTDDHARITARLIVAIIAFICAAMFFANARLRAWRVPGTAIILMVVSSLLIQGIYPAVIQRFDVRPSEPDRERPYIQNQIAATRQAYDIDDVSITDYSAKTDVSQGQLKSDAEALPAIRLMDPAIIAPTFEQLQQVRGFYTFPNVLDVDRYEIDGKKTDTVVAAREIDINGLPDQSWNNIHTVYTHGFGMVASYGSRAQANGEPEWIEWDIPPQGKLNEQQPRIYFGENQNQYVIAGNVEGADPVELDTPGGNTAGGEQHSTYTGTGGVPIGNPITRAMYATKFGDMNLLLSGRVNQNSQILYNRTPQERVKAVAPWLTVDQDPYPAVVDGRIVWIADAYTSTANYPNSQHINMQDTISDSASSWRQGTDTKQVNYVRNSVKAVVDAYDGSVKLYAWDTSDPILKTWEKAFPGVLTDKSQASPELLSHLRYPQDLFKVQRQILGRYHMTDPGNWYNQSDLWVVPADPRDKSGKAEPPYYLSIKWPGDAAPVFSQTAVYVPNKRENMGAYMSVVADTSNPDYGKIRVLRLSDTQQVPGPNQTYNAISSDQSVADHLLPFVGQGGSGSADALYGNLLTLPLGDGLIYIEPIYTQRKDSSAGSYPVLRFVVARYGTHIGIGTTLQEALDTVFGGNAGASTGENAQPGQAGATQQVPATGEEAVKANLQAANDAFSSADKALKAGDLATYQSQMQVAQAKVSEAMAAAGG
ncbi:UPF0182 family protein [Propionibacterium freudenreichii]|uniref:UPF0182 family membrane protein n=1 Tax=Propionibacterium freudenreichii TaxID=1744 RepID=UPI000BC2E220|nr:UPF0182 family protein [Propionibacterium freudenreichii]MDK9593209.1 UPF0182 family protein [Propionibacterium freudenreichii]WFF34024.1 UPF0182 family protein [Propionibacterium freudenreichii]WFF36255.1 UPF0182 family protein [Propionibacterium freudenreichii]SBN52003.1 UPF0182 protein [Propionibacterium freudenreichii]